MPRAIAARKGEAGRRTGGGPWLIKHGSDCPYVEQVIASPSTVAGLPFDGFVVDGVTNLVSSNAFSPTAVSLADCTGSLSGMAAAKSSFGQNNRYFLRILTLANLDWWNDSQWTTIAANLAHVAQAALAEGFTGLCFDPEFYGSGQSPWDWGGTSPGAFGDSGADNPASPPATGADPTHNLQDYRTKVQARGKAVMDAILAQWPTCRLLMLHGPYVSFHDTEAALGNTMYGDVAWANEGMGTFAGGFIESINAAGNRAQFIDGGEIYGARSYADFRKINDWRLNGIKASTSNAVSSGVKANLRSIMAVGVEELDILTGGFPRLSVGTFQNLITWALRNNSWVWTYTETENWWGGSFPATPVSSTWKDAVAAARLAGRL